MIKRFSFLVIAVFIFTGLALAQADPAKAEDAAIERQRILKATDQIEMLTEQVSKMQQDLQTMRQELEMMRTENYRLKQQMTLSETKRIKERDVILGEVAKNIAKVSQASPTPPPKESSAPTAPTKNERGYEHVVQKGETLWMIAKAYKDQGISVSVSDIRRANDMKPYQMLKIGQKIFIPAPSK